jgi:hypothetical protein
MARTIPVGPSGKDPLWGALGYITITVPTFSVGTGEIYSQKVSNNTGVHQGQMVGWKVNAGNPTNAITYTVHIKDRDGDVIYTSAGGHARNAVTVVMGLNVPIIERESIGILPSGDPGATSLICKVTLYYNPDADIIAWGWR